MFYPNIQCIYYIIFQPHPVNAHSNKYYKFLNVGSKIHYFKHQHVCRKGRVCRPSSSTHLANPPGSSHKFSKLHPAWKFTKTTITDRRTGFPRLRMLFPGCRVRGGDISTPEVLIQYALYQSGPANNSVKPGGETCVLKTTPFRI